ncbi:MAG: hypothetical protein ACI4QT_07655 [Kiritimatiellia bacterium]
MQFVQTIVKNVFEINRVGGLTLIPGKSGINDPRFSISLDKKKRRDFFPDSTIMVVINTRVASRHGQNRERRAIAHAKRLVDEVYGSLAKVKRRAVEALFDSIVRVGSPLVKDIALSVPNVTTSQKGLQEKVSGWLQRYDFATPVHDYLWREGARMIGADTVIAVDSGDISKEFGGKGMEGMEMGYDASRGVTAMGHSLLCAAIVLRRRATAWRLSLIKGRKGLPAKERELFDKIIDATGGKGIPVHDRGFDSEDFIAHVGASTCIGRLCG